MVTEDNGEILIQGFFIKATIGRDTHYWNDATRRFQPVKDEYCVFETGTAAKTALGALSVLTGCPDDAAVVDENDDFFEEAAACAQVLTNQ
ncbi:MAG: hypothetical protein WCG99_03980 [Candidatus Berkelbacteria bacterium]